MLAGHVDEIGFVITEIKKEGYLSFYHFGGWLDQTCSVFWRQDVRWCGTNDTYHLRATLDGIDDYLL